MRPLFLLLLLLVAANATAETKILAYSIGRSASRSDPYKSESERQQIGRVVRRIHQDRSGNFWFGMEEGVARFDGASLTFYDLRDELGQGITVKTIVEDAAGHIWFGTTGGVTRFDGQFFTSYDQRDGMIDNGVWSLCIDSRGTLWIGSFGGLTRYDGSTFTPFPIPAATELNWNRGVVSPTIVWSIIEDNAGHMWFAAEGGPYRWDGETLTRVPVMEEESTTFVNVIQQDAGGSFWFATQAKGLIRLDGDTFTDVSRQVGVAGARPGGINADADGNLWIHSGGGVYRHDGTTFDKVLDEQDLGEFGVFCTMIDKDGRLWLGGRQGVYRLDGDNLVNVTREGPW